MQTTRLTQHGLLLCRKHRSVGTTEYSFAEKRSSGNTWDGFIMLLWYTGTLKLMFFIQLKCKASLIKFKQHALHITRSMNQNPNSGGKSL